MKAIFINGSPRKNKNTAQMLEAALVLSVVWPLEASEAIEIVKSGNAHNMTNKLVRDGQIYMQVYCGVTAENLFLDTYPSS